MTRYKVLIPLDGSAFSRQILAQVRHMLKPADHELILMQVGQLPIGIIGAPPRPVTVGWMSSMYERPRDLEYTLHPIYGSQLEQSERTTVEQELLADQAMLEHAGYAVSVVVRFGDPAQEIVDFAEHAAVDLVAMATHGQTGLRHLLSGSVAEQALRRLTIPILLIRPSDNMPDHATGDQAQRPMTVVVSLDGSAFAEQALDQACVILAENIARLVLVAVEPTRDDDDIGLAQAGVVPYWALADQEAETTQLAAYLQRIAKQLAHDGLVVKTRLCSGMPAEEILRVSIAEQADVIVMATHGRGGIKRLLLGSVAAKVLQNADRPLLLVRPHEQSKPSMQAETGVSSVYERRPL